MGLDAGKSVADYRALAVNYDHATRRINCVRHAAIAALALQPGETVLDAGCGTGYCFSPVMAAIGARGTLLAFDHSADMLAIAHTALLGVCWCPTSPCAIF